MRANTSVMQKANLGLHAFQGVWSVVLLGVSIASMTQSGPSSGAIKYFFAMCWLNIPGLIYLTLSPRFPRTKMFAHPFWILGINVLYCILWFAAFVAVAAYTNSGVKSGEKKDSKKSGCDAFEKGTGEAAKACTLNHDAVGLGVVMWFAWLATTGIAGYAAFYFSKHSVSPFEDLSAPSHDIQETTKDAFSSNDEYAPINRHEGQEDLEDDRNSAYTHERSDSVASSHYDQYGDAHPGRPVSWAADREPYAGIGGHAPSGSTPIAPAPVLPPVEGISMPEGPEDYGYHPQAVALR